MPANLTESLNRAKKFSAADMIIQRSEQANRDTEPTQKQVLERNTEPQNFGFTPKKCEKKTERLQLLLKPSTLRALDKIAKESKLSRNELINQMLEACTSN